MNRDAPTVQELLLFAVVEVDTAGVLLTTSWRRSTFFDQGDHWSWLQRAGWYLYISLDVIYVHEVRNSTSIVL